jgi:predicted protein tyrosine phosphatase
MTRAAVTGPVVTVAASRAPRWICSKSKGHTVKGVLSIMDPVGFYHWKRPFGLHLVPTLRLSFEDVELTTRQHAPTVNDVECILKWGARHHDHFNNPQHPDRVIIHCYAGVSRSTAATFICFAQALGPGQEAEAWTMAKAAQEQRPFLPNELIVVIADKLLNRNGRMTAMLDP